MEHRPPCSSHRSLASPTGFHAWFTRKYWAPCGAPDSRPDCWAWLKFSSQPGCATPLDFSSTCAILFASPACTGEWPSRSGLGVSCTGRAGAGGGGGGGSRPLGLLLLVNLWFLQPKEFCTVGCLMHECVRERESEHGSELKTAKGLNCQKKQRGSFRRGSVVNESD